MLLTLMALCQVLGREDCTFQRPEANVQFSLSHPYLQEKTSELTALPPLHAPPLSLSLSLFCIVCFCTLQLSLSSHSPIWLVEKVKWPMMLQPPRDRGERVGDSLNEENVLYCIGWCCCLVGFCLTKVSRGSRSPLLHSFDMYLCVRLHHGSFSTLCFFSIPLSFGLVFPPLLCLFVSFVWSMLWVLFSIWMFYYLLMEDQHIIAIQLTWDSDGGNTHLAFWRTWSLIHKCV